MMKIITSSETSDYTEATRCHIPENSILHSHPVKSSNVTKICSVHPRASNAKFETLKKAAFWDLTPYYSGRTDVSEECIATFITVAGFPTKLPFSKESHSATSLKTALFIITAIRTSNLT
jgi:hypothetical protein